MLKRYKEYLASLRQHFEHPLEKRFNLLSDGRNIFIFLVGSCRQRLEKNFPQGINPIREVLVLIKSFCSYCIEDIGENSPLSTLLKWSLNFSMLKSFIDPSSKKWQYQSKDAISKQSPYEQTISITAQSWFPLVPSVISSSRRLRSSGTRHIPETQKDGTLFKFHLYPFRLGLVNTYPSTRFSKRHKILNMCLLLFRNNQVNLLPCRPECRTQSVVTHRLLSTTFYLCSGISVCKKSLENTIFKLEAVVKTAINT